MLLTTEREKVINFLDKYKQLPMRYDLADANAPYSVYVDDEKNITCVVIEYIRGLEYGIFGTNEKILDEAYEQFLSDKRVWLDAVDTRVFECLKKYGLVYEEICNMYEFQGEIAPISCPYEIKDLFERDYKTVKSHYQYPVKMEDIIKCGKLYPSSAAYDGDKMVSWCMVHENHSMGPIFTLPEYRGKNAAFAVTNDLIGKMLKRNMTPYCLIVIGNTSSEKLAAKAGFKANGVKVGWCHKKK